MSSLAFKFHANEVAVQLGPGREVERNEDAF